jgi:hypothetical protein
MTYQKPAVVLNGTAISAIEDGLNKMEDIQDVNQTLSNAAYRSDE